MNHKLEKSVDDPHQRYGSYLHKVGYIAAKGVRTALTTLECIELCHELSKYDRHQRQSSTGAYAGDQSDSVQAPIELVRIAKYPLSSNQRVYWRPQSTTPHTK